LSFTLSIDELPVLGTLAAQGSVAFHGGFEVSLVVSLIGALVEVEGQLTGSVEQLCSRCLQPTVQPLILPILLTYNCCSDETAVLDVEQELTGEEIGLICFDGEVIDLRLAIEQELLMTVPQHPLCRAGCAGLCPECGTDLNYGKCDCSPLPFHGGLAALKNFKVTQD
jgi:uncharacterized protein